MQDSETKLATHITSVSLSDGAVSGTDKVISAGGHASDNTNASELPFADALCEAESVWRRAVRSLIASLLRSHLFDGAHSLFASISMGEVDAFTLSALQPNPINISAMSVRTEQRQRVGRWAPHRSVRIATESCNISLNFPIRLELFCVVR